jgi:hypothetical protein
MRAKTIGRLSCVIAVCLLGGGDAKAVMGNTTGTSLLGTSPSIVSVDTFSGSASGSYTFSAPPGRLGIQPELRIVYNSGSGGASPLGRGWNFTFPTIQRSTRKGQPSFTWADTFNIRWGGRVVDLVQICDPSSGCPAGVHEYRTENESFIRIRSFSNAPFLTYWRVEDGSGRAYQFGNNGGSGTWTQVEDFQWALNRVEDAHGNYLTMDWMIDSGVLYPREIEYTGNVFTGLLPSNRVQFDYEGRFDVVASRLGVRPSTSTDQDMQYRLLRLKSWAGSQVASVYFFRYSTDGAGYYTDMCSGVECGVAPYVCPNGYIGSCNHVCQPSTGFCVCQSPDCGSGGGGGPGGGGCGQSPCPPDIESVAWFPMTDEPSLLTDIERWDAAGTTSLPSTTFSYVADTARDWTDLGTGVPALFAERVDPLFEGRSFIDHGAVIAEVNGDGLPDLIRSRDPGCGDPATKEVYINNNGSWVLDTSYVLPIPTFVVHECGGEDHDNGMRVLDFNGDGLDDVVQAYMLDGPGNNCFGNANALWLNTGHGWTVAGSPVPIPFIACSDSDYVDLGVRFGDVNGDGLVDLISRRDDPTPNSGAVFVNTGTTWMFKAGWKVPEPMTAYENDWYDPGTRVVDINGDGLVDIVRAWSWNNTLQPTKVYLGMGTADAQGNVWRQVPIADPYADFPEIFSSVNNSSNRTFTTELGVRFGDVNGDGWIDIVRGYDAEQQNGSSLQTKRVYLHRAGKGWGEDLSWGLEVPYTFVRRKYEETAVYDQGVRLVDMDGNGAVDFVKSHRDLVTTTKRRALSTDGISNLLATSNNGIGGSTTLTYTPSTSYDNHALGSPPDARANLSLVLPLLSSVTTTDGQAGTGHTFTTSYSYRGGYLSPYPRREFRGFRYVRTNLPGGESYTEQLFVQNPELQVAPLMGSLERSAIRRTSDDAVLSASKNTFDRTDVVAPYFQWLAQTEEFLYDWGAYDPIQDLDETDSVKRTASAHTYSFDGSGFIAAHESQALGDSTTPGDDLYVTEEYLNDTTGGRWWIRVPKRGFATSNAGGAGEVLTESRFYYDGLALGQIGAKGELTRTERWTGAEYVGVSLGYATQYGHVTSRTDEVNHVLNMQYGVSDSTFTFLDGTSATTTGGGVQVNHSTTYQYDPRFGLVTNVTSTGAGSVSTAYDAFGRPTKSWTSLDSSALPTVCYTYDLLSPFKSVARFERETSGQGDACGPTGMLGSAVFFDGLGRKIASKTESAEPGLSIDRL